MLGRNCARESDRPIKSNQNSRAADEREQSRTHLAMHVDHQIVFGAPDLLEQIEEAECGAPFLSRLGEIATRKEYHIRESVMMADRPRILPREQLFQSRPPTTR